MQKQNTFVGHSRHFSMQEALDHALGQALRAGGVIGPFTIRSGRATDASGHPELRVEVVLVQEAAWE